MLLFALTVLISLSVPRDHYGTISAAIFGARKWTDLSDKINKTSRTVYDGHWYNFGRPPQFVFYVYSAFLVDHKPHDVIRLISITSPPDHFIRQRLDVLCVVHYEDGRSPHVASILRPPPRRILEPGNVVGHGVGDYVYSCSLPEHPQNSFPVSIMMCRI